MIYLTKKEGDKIASVLSKTADKEIKRIIKKLEYPQKKKVYLYNNLEIEKLIKKAFNEKRRIKIRYYSPHSDEHTTRMIEIYKTHNNAIIAFCHLREEERTFVIDKINSV